MSRKDFSVNFNEELDSLGFPMDDSERIHALSKVLEIKPFQAASILHGDCIPNTDILNKISKELEINTRILLERSKH